MIIKADFVINKACHLVKCSFMDLLKQSFQLNSSFAHYLNKISIFCAYHSCLVSQDTYSTIKYLVT